MYAKVQSSTKSLGLSNEVPLQTRFYFVVPAPTMQWFGFPAKVHFGENHAGFGKKTNLLKECRSLFRVLQSASTDLFS